tara:strand:- start:236 stop:637 length:402 start_codon:yes stop_codon:yes gene_type:complete
MINPNEIRWVSNTKTKPHTNQLNLLSVKRKCDYPDDCTIVKLTNIKRKFPHADVRFDNGLSSGLCYLFHADGGGYQKDPTTNMYVYVPNHNPPPPEQAYQHSVTNTYGMTDESLIELTEQLIYIKKVLIHNIL